MNEKEGRLVFNAQVANTLLHKGYQIMELKRNKHNPDKTVFVFARENHIDDALHEVLNSIKS